MVHASASTKAPKIIVYQIFSRLVIRWSSLARLSTATRCVIRGERTKNFSSPPFSLHGSSEPAERKSPFLARARAQVGPRCTCPPRPLTRDEPPALPAVGRVRDPRSLVSSPELRKKGTGSRRYASGREGKFSASFTSLAYCLPTASFFRISFLLDFSKGRKSINVDFY